MQLYCCYTAADEQIHELLMSRDLRLIIMGILGRTPLAGVSWQVLHYLEGFRRLGYDIYYIEDTGGWAYNPRRTKEENESEHAYAINCQYAVSYVAKLMSSYGLQDRWAYRSRVDGQIFGLSETQVSRLFETADALVNLTGFGYQPTRQPVVLDWWTPDAQLSSARNGQLRTTGCFTTIAKWRQPGKDIEWNGQTYSWSKDIEFLKFIDLPLQTEQEFELALLWEDEKDEEVTPQLRSHRWRVVDALSLSLDILPYRHYILGSRGEFTVAKDQNIRLRSGWFSDRSACYLAAGKPVVTQDTAFDKILPTGRGLFAFRTMEDILAAIDTIQSDYNGHCRAAREIAEEYFAAERVLGDLMDRVGL